MSFGPVYAPTRPGAAVRIAPEGLATKVPRDYYITIDIGFSKFEPQFIDPEHVSEVARRALIELRAHHDELDRIHVRSLQSPRKLNKDGNPVTAITGVEGSLLCAGRPDDEAIERLRASLAAAGYRVSTQEQRECAEPGCSCDAMIDWSRRTESPQGWFSAETCGRHQYRRCADCDSVYVFRSSNSAGPAPAVHCSVCTAILVEWGSSKLWEAELVTAGTRRGTAGAAPLPPS